MNIEITKSEFEKLLKQAEIVLYRPFSSSIIIKGMCFNYHFEVENEYKKEGSGFDIIIN
jgi:hypothetical protein